ncbi:hypothetical protein F511_24649 [Dorcoceras hygrometricum]|uniref:Uncharacterized protein n=1 Tax=Dorcoceras hygrometricum TaxID=472368 RepID=A0A2Z7CJT1_9LAMI|nr:hypothetical protein F511_24649 [Dorcoceras hygrometricum]
MTVLPLNSGKPRNLESSTCVTLNGLGIQLAVDPQPLRLRNHNFGLAQRIMVKCLEPSPHDPLGITDSACKNQSVVVSVQYGPFNPYIPIRSTTIGKSRVAIDPIAMHISWRSNSDIASVTSIGYPRMSASGESSTTMHRLLHASGSHPIPTPYDPKTNQYNKNLGLIHSINGNHLESPKEGSSIDHQIAVETPIRSTTRSETPSSHCTRSPDEISTNGFSTSSWPETNFPAKTAAAAAHGGGGGGERREGREAAYLCDPQWFRDTASRGPTTIVAPESQFLACPTDHGPNQTLEEFRPAVTTSPERRPATAAPPPRENSRRQCAHHRAKHRASAAHQRSTASGQHRATSREERPAIGVRRWPPSATIALAARIIARHERRTAARDLPIPSRNQCAYLGRPWRNRPATIVRVAWPARDMRSPIARPARDGAARDVSHARHGGRRRARRRPASCFSDLRFPI